MMNISPRDLGKVIASGATILDVRNPPEHAEQRLIAAHELVPLDRLDPADFMLRRGLDAAAPVYLLCRGGVRAAKAAQQFEQAGYKNMYVIEGGILACDPALTVGDSAPAACSAATGKKSMSLDDQSRFIAGLLVVCGIGLGLLVKKIFLLLAFLVGIGLAVSGATGRCHMSVLLAKAPWNKNKAATCSLPKTPDKPTAGGCA